MHQLFSPTHFPNWLKQGSKARRQVLQWCQLGFETTTEEELWSVDIGEALGALPQHNLVEEQLLDGGQQGALGEDQVPDLARGTRTQVGQVERQSFCEKPGHKDVVLPHHGKKILLSFDIFSSIVKSPTHIGNLVQSQCCCNLPKAKRCPQSLPATTSTHLCKGKANLRSCCPKPSWAICGQVGMRPDL